MSTEATVVIGSAAPAFDPAKFRQISELAGRPLDWSKIAALAEVHGTLPLLARQLGTLYPDSLPPLIREQLKLIATRNLQLTSELLAFIDLFRQRSIRLLPYKGPALAQQLYGDLGLRTSHDLDIVVRRRDVTEAITILESRGYSMRPEALQMPRDVYMRSYSDYEMVRADGMIVELHWTFTSHSFPFDFDIEALWDRLDSIEIAGRAVPVMRPEDLLLILAVHGSRHLWQRLSWIVDIAQLIRKYPRIDWERVIHQARNSGVLRMLMLALDLARELFDTPLPDEIVREIRIDRAVPGLAAQVRDLLFKPRSVRWREEAMFHLRIRERTSDRVRYILRHAFTPAVGDFNFVQLPKPLFPFYPLIRLVRLCTKYGAGVSK